MGSNLSNDPVGTGTATKGVSPWVLDVDPPGESHTGVTPATVSILCPFCGGHLGDLTAEPGGYMVYHRERNRVVPSSGSSRSDSPSVRLPRRYVTVGNDASQPITLTCARNGHRTLPLLAEWFSTNAVPAIASGYETVTVNRRHMEVS